MHCPSLKSQICLSIKVPYEWNRWALQCGVAPKFAGKLSQQLASRWDGLGTPFPSPAFYCTAQYHEKARGGFLLWCLCSDMQSEAAQGNPAQQRLMWPTYNCVKRCHSAPLSKRLLVTSPAIESPAPSAKHSFLALNHHCPLASCLEFAHYTEKIYKINLYIFKTWQIVL